MNKFKIFLPALTIIVMASCSPSTTSTSGDKALIDSVRSEKDTALVAKMSFPSRILESTPVEMTFTVYNNTDSTKTFCKWHTPFEPSLSKYLDITSTSRVEAEYKGAMAKRIMPPPADSYMSIKPGDSLAIKVDLTKTYIINSIGIHKVHYNSEGISGLKVEDVTFTIEK